MALWHKKYMRAFRGCDTLSASSIPRTHPGQVFFRNASGDFLSAINYFDFRDDILGGKKKPCYRFFCCVFFLQHQCAHTNTLKGVIPNLWSGHRSHSHLSNRTCERGNEVTLRSHPLSDVAAKSLQQGRGAVKNLRHVYASLWRFAITWPAGSWCSTGGCSIKWTSSFTVFWRWRESASVFTSVSVKSSGKKDMCNTERGCTTDFFCSLTVGMHFQVSFNQAILM